MYTLITDMDKTIVYSKAETEDAVCVETDKKGRPITYMTKPASEQLKKLLTWDNFNLIPCTLRSIEQVSRIHFIDKCNTIICDNGGSIYVNGTIDSEWDKKIESIIDKNDVHKRRDMAESYAKEHNIEIYRIKSNRDCFVSVIFYSLTTAQAHVKEFMKLFPDTYDVHNQGKKIYFVPKGLNKKIAVDYITEKSQGTIITAGDSSVDECFVGAGDINITPLHATFKKNNVITTKTSGIKAGEEIINLILKYCDMS